MRERVYSSCEYLEFCAALSSVWRSSLTLSSLPSHVLVASPAASICGSRSPMELVSSVAVFLSFAYSSVYSSTGPFSVNTVRTAFPVASSSLMRARTSERACVCVLYSAVSSASCLIDSSSMDEYALA